jgi:hypothetical protein
MPATWRDHPYHVMRFLHLLAPATVFAARVNQASFTYPLAQVTFDGVTTGAYGDIVPGMTVLFGTAAGADDRGRQRVRKAATSSLLYVGWSSRGIRDGELDLSDDLYITVLDDYRAWAKIPRITQAGVMYKDFDTVIADGTPAPPVANGGPGYAGFVNASTGLITVDFTAANSFATAPGAALTTYAWDFGDGTPGTASTSVVSNVTFPAGFRWVSLTVTDDNSKTHTCRIPIFAAVDTGAGTELSYAGATFSASFTDPGSLPDNAFDNSNATHWESSPAETEWLAVALSGPAAVGGYRVYGIGTGAVRDWTLEYKVGVNWIIADTQTNQSAGVLHAYTLSAPITATEWRLNITANNGDILELNVYEFDLLSATTRNYISNFEVTSHTLTPAGQRIEFVIHEAIPETTYPDGTLVMYWEEEVYNGVAGSLAGVADREHVKFIGWHDTDTARLTIDPSGPIPSVSLAALDIGGRLAQLPGFPQVVERDASPSKWTQLASANLDRYVHYLLYWHSTALEVADFTWSGTLDTYGFSRLVSPGESLWEQASTRARAMDGVYLLTCNKFGQLAIKADPQLQDTGDRTATVITDIDETDWAGEPTYTHQRAPRVHWNWGSAIVAGTSEADSSTLKIRSVFCVAPGEAPGQGATANNQGEMLVQSQDVLNNGAGHAYTRVNAPEGLWEVPLAHGGDIGIDPAALTWVRMTVSADTAAQRGLALTDERFLPVEVLVEHDNANMTKVVRLRLEREQVGTPAQTFVPKTGTVVPVTPPITDWTPWPYTDITGLGSLWLHRGVKKLAVFSTDNYLNITTDFSVPSASGGPAWTRQLLSVDGAIVQFVVDAFSPLYLGTGTTVNGWLFTTEKIYRITDIFGTVGLTAQHTFNAATVFSYVSGNIHGGRRSADASFGVQNHVACCSYYKNHATYPGVWAAYTTDGVNWTEVQVTAGYHSGSWGGAPEGGWNIMTPGCYVSSHIAGRIYTTAVKTTGNPPTCKGYVSSDYGATWAELTGSNGPAMTLGESLANEVHVPWHDNAADNLVYYGWRDYGVGVDGKIYRNADMIFEDARTPTASRWFIVSSAENRQYMAASLLGQDAVESGLYVSKDAGTTWTLVAEDYVGRVALAGDNNEILYFLGETPGGQKIQYSQDFGGNFDDRTGSLAIGSNNFVGLCGG